MPQFQCVIFDVDGTLTRTNDLIFASFNHVASRYLGRTFSNNEIIAMFGPPEEGALRAILPAEAIEDAMNVLCAFYEQHHAAMAALHPGMDAVLGLLRARGVKTAVFTGKGRRTAEITLAKLGVKDGFDLIISGSDVRKHKPDAEGILKILSDLRVPAAATLMVGDSLGDLTAARDAGVAMAAVYWDSYDHERVHAHQPDVEFFRVEDFLHWLEHHTETVATPTAETVRWKNDRS